jgi:phage host-nuclease inhibitor protein Gam
MFLASHRNRLVEEQGKKSFVLKRSGWTVRWRETSKVLITGSHAPIIAALERNGHHDCVIVKKSINRRVLGMRHDIVRKIRGLKLDRTEVLSINPPKQ